MKFVWLLLDLFFMAASNLKKWALLKSVNKFNAMIYKCHKAVFYSQLSIETYQMVEPKKEVFDHF